MHRVSEHPYCDAPVAVTSTSPTVLIIEPSTSSISKARGVWRVMWFWIMGTYAHGRLEVPIALLSPEPSDCAAACELWSVEINAPASMVKMP
jgi:hypothetical protein